MRFQLTFYVWILLCKLLRERLQLDQYETVAKPKSAPRALNRDTPQNEIL